MSTKDKKKEIRISNALSSASQRLTLSEKRLMSLVLKAIKRPLKEGEVFKTVIGVNDLVDLSKISKTTAYTELKSAEKTLWRKAITWRWGDAEDGKGASKWTWIIGVDYLDGALGIHLNPLLNPHVSDLQKRFTVYDLGVAGKFKSINTWRLYELLRRERKRGELLISVADFRHAMDIEPNKYKEICDIEKRIIKPAIKEIKEKAALDVSFKKVKKERVITSFAFAFKTEKKESKGEEQVPLALPALKKTKSIKPIVGANVDENAKKAEVLRQYLHAIKASKLANQPLEMTVSIKEIEEFRQHGLMN